MKNIFKYTTMLLATGVLLFASCEKFLDVNTDPNNPTEVSPDLLLPVAQKYTANMMTASDGGGRRLAALGNLMMYNWSQSDGYAWYPDEFKYLVNSNFYAVIFDETYSNALKQYNTLTELDPKYDYYKAIAMIMKAFHYQILVDCYGDVPYSEALQRGELPTPVYDDAQTIYEDLIVQLSAAIDVINNVDLALVEDVDNDMMFGGDMDLWKQFANTLKLRILVRQMSMTGREAYIQAQFDAIAAEGSGFILNQDAAINPGYQAMVEGKQNPFWNLYGWNAGGTPDMTNLATCATDYILDYFVNTNDTRIDFIYEKPATGHLGVPQGLLDYDTPVKDAFIPELVSNIGPGILKSATQDVVIYTLAEIYFNLAEAVYRGYLAGDAKTLYENGITASFLYLDVVGDNGTPDDPDDDIQPVEMASNYYTQNVDNVGYDFSTDKIEAIITQKWIATNGITAEQAWFEYNRTGFPSDLPISELATTSDRPVRLYYTASELVSNSANVPAQPDAFTDKIFWGN